MDDNKTYIENITQLETIHNNKIRKKINAMKINNNITIDMTMEDNTC